LRATRTRTCPTIRPIIEPDPRIPTERPATPRRKAQSS
jgi:hypothetical protein